ncbi:MAG: endolytic transglycosylase MltG [Ginsengibacter sp.]
MKKIIPLVFIIILAVAGYMAWLVIGPTVVQPESKYFYVKTGSTYPEVKQRLTALHIIQHPQVFDKVAGYLKYPSNVKAGRYLIKPGTNILNLIKMLRAGQQQPVNLVINKLRTKDDFIKKLRENFEADSSDVVGFIHNPDSLMRFNVDSNTLLSLVIPNTYKFYWNTTVSNIFKKLETENKVFWSTERTKQAQQHGLSPKQVYTLASIVEEETNAAADKGKIASVYINRLNKGMRLAADPTVKFAMNDFSLKRIYFKHLNVQSPYNTYINAGLPPGPICTPSIKTLDAVLTSPKTDYIFFVAKPDFSGSSNFAVTYDQHKVFAKAYQQALDSLIKAKGINQDSVVNSN